MTLAKLGYEIGCAPFPNRRDSHRKWHARERSTPAQEALGGKNETLSRYRCRCRRAGGLFPVPNPLGAAILSTAPVPDDHLRGDPCPALLHGGPLGVHDRDDRARDVAGDG